jgi:phospholipase/carboxylesterase
MIHTDLFKYDCIPAAKPSDKLMIVLHGRGDSLKPFLKINEELEVKNINFLLLNAPKKFQKGFSWYGEPPYLSHGVQSIRAKLLLLLEQLEEQGWKSENIFIFGFSQGCLVGADLALHYPKKLAGVIGVSGYFNFFSRWKNQLNSKNKNTPWLFTHGTKDKILPIETTRFGVRKLQSAGLNVNWIELNKRHTFEQQEMPLIKKWLESHL